MFVNHYKEAKYKSKQKGFVCCCFLQKLYINERYESILAVHYRFRHYACDIIVQRSNHILSERAPIEN